MLFPFILVLFIAAALQVRAFSPARGIVLKKDSKSARAVVSMGIKLARVGLNVPDLAESTKFYHAILPRSSKLASENTFSLGNDALLQLHQYDSERSGGGGYDKGDGLRGLTIAQPDAEKLLAHVPSLEIVRPFDEYKIGPSIIPEEDDMLQVKVRYAHIKDPAGFTMEIREDDQAYTRLVLNVEDIEESIAFYTEVLGYTLCRKRSNVNNEPKEASFTAFLSNGDEREAASLELVYPYSTEKIAVGNCIRELVFASDSLPAIRSVLLSQKKAFEYDDKAGLTVVDPSGYKITVISA